MPSAVFAFIVDRWGKTLFKVGMSNVQPTRTAAPISATATPVPRATDRSRPTLLMG